MLDGTGDLMDRAVCWNDCFRKGLS